MISTTTNLHRPTSSLKGQRDIEKSKKSQTKFSHTVIVVIVHATVLRLGDTLSGVAKRGFALALKAGFC